MMRDEFELPPSVRAYLETPAVRSGVDALLAVEPDSLPDGLEWIELGDYLSARAVAELTRSEWAVMLHRLWREVWATIEEEGWRAAPFDELDTYENPVTPTACWTEQRFSLWHSRRPLSLYTGVRVTRAVTQVAFSLEGRKVLLKDGDEHFAWSDGGDWDGWLVATLDRSPAAPDFDLARLRAFAATALRRIRDAAPR